jgi:hypothetical protein
MQKVIHDNKQMLSMSDQEKEKMAQKLSDYEEQLKQAVAESKDLHSKLDALNKQLEHVETSSSEMKGRLSEAIAAHAHTQGLLDAAVAARSAAVLSESQARAEAEKAQREVAEAIAAAEQAKSDASAVRAEMDAGQVAIRGSMTDVEAKLLAAEKRSLQLNTRVKELQSAETLAQQLNTRVAELEAAEETAKAELSSVRATVKSAEGVAAKYERQLAEQQAEREMLEKHHRQLQESNKQLRKQLNQLQLQQQEKQQDVPSTTASTSTANPTSTTASAPTSTPKRASAQDRQTDNNKPPSSSPAHAASLSRDDSDSDNSESSDEASDSRSASVPGSHGTSQRNTRSAESASTHAASSSRGTSKKPRKAAASTSTAAAETDSDAHTSDNDSAGNTLPASSGAPVMATVLSSMSSSSKLPKPTISSSHTEKKPVPSSIPSSPAASLASAAHMTSPGSSTLKSLVHSLLGTSKSPLPRPVSRRTTLSSAHVKSPLPETVVSPAASAYIRSLGIKTPRASAAAASARANNSAQSPNSPVDVELDLTTMPRHQRVREHSHDPIDYLDTVGSSFDSSINEEISRPVFSQPDLFTDSRGPFGGDTWADDGDLFTENTSSVPSVPSGAGNNGYEKYIRRRDDGRSDHTRFIHDGASRSGRAHDSDRVRRRDSTVHSVDDDMDAWFEPADESNSRKRHRTDAISDAPPFADIPVYPRANPTPRFHGSNIEGSNRYGTSRVPSGRTPHRVYERGDHAAHMQQSSPPHAVFSSPFSKRPRQLSPRESAQRLSSPMPPPPPPRDRASPLASSAAARRLANSPSFPYAASSAAKRGYSRGHTPTGSGGGYTGMPPQRYIGTSARAPTYGRNGEYIDDEGYIDISSPAPGSAHQHAYTYASPNSSVKSPRARVSKIPPVTSLYSIPRFNASSGVKAKYTVGSGDSDSEEEGDVIRNLGNTFARI